MKLTHLTIKELQAMNFSALSERQLQEVIAEILMRILILYPEGCTVTHPPSLRCGETHHVVAKAKMNE